MNLLELSGEIEGVATRAAQIYGQDWGNLNLDAQAKWRSGVEAMARPASVAQTALDKAATQAIAEWTDAKNGVVPVATAKAAPAKVVEKQPAAPVKGKK